MATSSVESEPSPKKRGAAASAPKQSLRKEFGGGPGAFLVVFGLPVFITFVHIAIAFWNWNLFVWSNYEQLLSRLPGYLSQMGTSLRPRRPRRRFL